jgi:peptide/nickel transport system permease protein
LSLIRFIGKRALLLLPMLVGLISLTFVLSHIIPGDPARLAAGEQATPEAVERVRRDFGLDRPLWQQYLRYLGGLAKGDLGRSITTDRPVAEDIANRLPASVELALVATAMAVSVGIALGVISAVGQNSRIDHGIRFFAISTVSLPRFWLALVLQLVFAGMLGVLPISGRIDSNMSPPPTITGLYLLDSLLAMDWKALWSTIVHLVMPSIALAAYMIGVAQRLMRASVIEVLQRDYILNARVTAGLPNHLVYFKYALKSALIPTISQLGLNFGAVLGGSLLVETVFDWPGLGTYITRAALEQDFQPIIGGAIVTGLIFIFVNLLTDLLYAALDPRIQYEGAPES